MRRLLKWGCLGFIGLTILGAIISAIGGGTKESATPTPQPAVARNVEEEPSEPTATLPPPTDTPAPPTDTPAPPTDTPVPTPTPAPMDFTGAGQQVTPKFDLQPGLVQFRMTHDGGGNFALQLLNAQGELEELLVNEIGAFDGGKAVGVDGGTYVMDVAADGNWTLRIEQPGVPADIAVAPQTFQGRGQQVSPWVQLPGGLTTFRMQHDGQANFAIILLDRKGQMVDLLVNEIGAFDGSTAIGADAGAYLLDISADGNWTISVE